MSKPRVVSFHYTLKDKEGNTLDSSSGQSPLMYLEGGSQIIPGLETQMKNLKVGDKKNIAVKAAEAYGEFDAELVFDVPRDRFPKTQKIEVGMQFQAGGPEGGHSPVFTVVEVKLESVRVDGNHPLAGKDLFFDVEVTEARTATEEELAHGHAHGGDGHHHH